MRPLHLALGAAALLGFAFSRGGGGSPPAKPRATGSRRFTGQRKSDLITFNLVNGEVQESPELVAEAISRALNTKIPVGTVALASMLSSESGGAPDNIRIALGWTALNRVKKWNQSLTRVLIPNGHFGEQGSGERQFATSKPPTKRDLALAIKLASGKYPDPTKGSTHFDHPKAQRAFAAQNAYGYTKSPEAVAAERIASGRKMVTLPGVSPDYLRFWA